MIIWLVELTAFHEASARVEVQQASHTQALLGNVLSGLCDAVVSLDGSFKFAQRSPKLTSLLLRGPSFGDPRLSNGPSLFADIVHEEDRSKFLDFMTACAKAVEEDITQSTHIRLLDSNGSAVPVMIVGSTLMPNATAGVICHMLGINMLGEDLKLPHAGAVDEVLFPPEFPPPSLLGMSSKSVSGGSSSHSATADADQVDLTISMMLVGGLVTAADCPRPDLVARYFKGLGVLGSSFFDSVCDGKAFVGWLTETMSAVFAGRVSLPHTERLGPTFFLIGKKRVMMNLTVHFPENAELLRPPHIFSDYVVVARITCLKDHKLDGRGGHRNDDVPISVRSNGDPRGRRTGTGTVAVTDLTFVPPAGQVYENGHSL